MNLHGSNMARKPRAGTVLTPEDMIAHAKQIVMDKGGVESVAAALGISRQYIYRVLQGRQKGPDLLERICAYGGIRTVREERWRVIENGAEDERQE